MLIEYSTSDHSFEPPYPELNAYQPEAAQIAARMLDIIDGNNYHVPRNCKFKTDIQDRIGQPAQLPAEQFGTLTAGTPKQGELDYEPDLDLFETALETSVTYRFTATALAPADVDLSEVDFYGQNTGLDTVSLKLRVLDAGGNEVLSSSDGSAVDFEPSLAGTYYVEVGRADPSELEALRTAGAYSVSIQVPE